MNLIAAVDSNWAIGNAGGLLVRIPNDMKYFRELTAQRVVVAGRKTIDTFPGGLPLQNRLNIILSENKDYKLKNAVVVHSLAELLLKTGQYDDSDIYVIGGQSVYAQLLAYCTTAYITKIEHTYAADAYLENLDKNKEWKLAEESEEQTYFDLEYVFRKYIRIKEAIKNE